MDLVSIVTSFLKGSLENISLSAGDTVDIVSRRLGYFVDFLSQNVGISKLSEQFNTFCRQQESTDSGHGLGSNKQQVMTLADIKPARKVKILRLGGSSQTDQRLAEAGITRGSVVSVVRVAPLGDPIEIEVDGRRFPIHKAEAHQIELEEPD